jgi:hypothetical protein
MRVFGRIHSFQRVFSSCQRDRNCFRAKFWIFKKIVSHEPVGVAQWFLHRSICLDEYYRFDSFLDFQKVSPTYKWIMNRKYKSGRFFWMGERGLIKVSLINLSWLVLSIRLHPRFLSFFSPKTALLTVKLEIRFSQNCFFSLEYYNSHPSKCNFALFNCVMKFSHLVTSM